MNESENRNSEELKDLKNLPKEMQTPLFLENKIVQQLKSEGMINNRNTFNTWLPRIAVAIVLFGLGYFFNSFTESKATTTNLKKDRYVLLLHQDENFGKGEAVNVAEYAQWFNIVKNEYPQALGERLLRNIQWAGKENSQSDWISGFFLIEAESDQEALEIAQSNPHIKYGGSIELRKIASGAPSPTPLSLTTRGVKIRVTDMDKAIEFYNEIIGFPIKDRSKYPNLVELENKGMKFWLQKVDEVREIQYGVESRTSLSIQTNNLDSIYAVYKEKGLNVLTDVQENGVGHSIPVRDPSGNVFSILEQDKYPVPRFKEPRIYNMGIVIPSIDGARPFYTKKLGFEVRSENFLPDNLPLNHTDKSFAIILHKKEVGPAGVLDLKTAQTNVVFEVDNLKKVKKQIEDLDIETIKTNPNQIAFKGPYGNIFEIIEKRK